MTDGSLEQNLIGNNLASDVGTYAILKKEYCAYISSNLSGILNIMKMTQEANTREITHTLMVYG